MSPDAVSPDTLYVLVEDVNHGRRMISGELSVDALSALVEDVKP